MGTTKVQLAQKIGRLIVARVPGLTLEGECLQLFRDGIIGGAVLFKENAETLDQLYELTSSIVRHSFHVPILTSDQEGGAIQRFEHVLTPIPSPMALAATGESDGVEKATYINAHQLKKLGFNCLLSPVLDVLTNQLNPIIGTRAFSDDPDKVAQIGKRVAQTISEAGLIPIGKHFPGHGSTLEDSHTDLAVNHADSTTLWQLDLMPFRNVINELPGILVGHVWLSAIDAEPLPATLSPRVTKGILREYLAYDGLIVSDDMIMKAITDRWGLAEACLIALEAGTDVLLVCGTLEQTISVHSHLLEAVESGRLDESLIDQAVARIDKLFSTRPVLLSETELEEFTNELPIKRERALKTSCAAVTILRGEIPTIDSGSWLLIVPKHPRYPMNLEKYLSSIAAHRFTSLTFSELRYPLAPTPEETESIIRQCTERNCIFLTYRSLINQSQLQLGSMIAEEAREKIVVSTDTPFDLLGLPDWENVAATYDPSELAMEALAKVLLGEFSASGICPVSLEFQIVKLTP